ncbi:SIS domain-containing protein [Candidatus Woesearchaeota archaeon]|nr:SIS domain-containing protein [Candidatus Woesearchaeota archaeon]
MVHKEYINTFFKECKTIIDEVNKEDINKVIELLFNAWKQGKQIFLMGNGGSASTATHFTADLAKTTMTKGRKRFKAICLNDNIPLMSAWVNDEGWENLYLGQLENLFEKGDILIGFSVHGGSGKGNAGNWSQNLTKAYQYVIDNKGTTIGFSGFDGGAMKQICDACVVVPFNATPHVEAFHVVLQHLIIFRLKELIQNYNE